MNGSVKLLPVVRTDLQKVKKWYNNQSEGLGEKFKAAFNKEIEYIRNNPLYYQIRYKEIRESLVGHFPYGIFYLFEEEKHRIVIVGVLYTKRNPKIIEKRLEK